MSPIIQATSALTWSTLVGFLAGYYTRKRNEVCPRNHGPFVRVPRNAQLDITMAGGVVLLEGFAEVEGTLTINAVNEQGRFQ